MAGLFGSPASVGWPIAWYPDSAWIGVPPHDGIVDDAFIGTKHDAFLRVERGLAVAALLSQWQNFVHLGPR